MNSMKSKIVLISIIIISIISILAIACGESGPHLTVDNGTSEGLDVFIKYIVPSNDNPRWYSEPLGTVPANQTVKLPKAIPVDKLGVTMELDAVDSSGNVIYGRSWHTKDFLSLFNRLGWEVVINNDPNQSRP